MAVLAQTHQEKLEMSLAEKKVASPIQSEQPIRQAMNSDDNTQARKSSVVAKPIRDKIPTKLMAQPKIIIELVRPAEIVPADITRAPVIPIPELLKDVPVSDFQIEPEAYLEYAGKVDAQPDVLMADEVAIFPIEIQDPVVELTDVINVNASPLQAEIYNDETMATFEELMSLFDAEEEVKPAAESVIYENFLQDIEIILAREGDEPVESNLFEEFIASQEQPEVVPDMEMILAHPNKQPLEETLVQLNFYLAEASPEAEHTEVEAALREVIMALPSGEQDVLTLEMKQIITPELTEKLLTLLSAVGYENPREVLVDFINQRSLEFLLQAIQHLYQLLDEANRQEFSPKLAINLRSMKSDDHLSIRIGRTILFYLFSPSRVALRPITMMATPDNIINTS